MAERLVVVSAPEGEIRGLVESAGAGVCIDAEQSEQLTRAILEAKGNPQRAAARARSGRKWVESNFVRDDLADNMLQFVERSAGRRS